MSYHSNQYMYMVDEGETVLQRSISNYGRKNTSYKDDFRASREAPESVNFEPFLGVLTGRN